MLAWQFEHLELDHRTCIYDTKVEKHQTAVGSWLLGPSAWRWISASKNHTIANATFGRMDLQLWPSQTSPNHYLKIFLIMTWNSKSLWFIIIKEISKSSRYFNPPWCFFPSWNHRLHRPVGSIQIPGPPVKAIRGHPPSLLANFEDEGKWRSRA